MKIQQTCAPSLGCLGKAKDLPQNTIFKLKGQTTTWLKFPQGYFDFGANAFWGTANWNNENTEVDLIYPNARIVLE